uniref:Uncharacterized protein n=1 Tax=Mycena chlorophos TaxID=658473 RepID=A0ABQ0LXB3_MYCCL|nr:predicted protein [Mycena chlorophos]
MGLHFYTTSPSSPKQQKARLGPSLALLRRQIPFVVFGEEALSIVHRVPTGFFDLHLLVPDAKLAEAASAICSDCSYYLSTTDDDRSWREMRMLSSKKEHAFNLNEDSLLLIHNSPKEFQEAHAALLVRHSNGIFMHKQSVFHFDLNDKLSVMLNPEPPAPEFAEVRFPRLNSFVDSAVATQLDPPLGRHNTSLFGTLQTWMTYVLLYAVPGHGHPLDKNKRPKPGVLELLAQLKAESQPTMIRRTLGLGAPPVEHAVLEWRDLRRERLVPMGIKDKPRNEMISIPPGIRAEPQPPRLTPLIRQTSNEGRPEIYWRTLPRYAKVFELLR